jgi:hypothetical protein
MSELFALTERSAEQNVELRKLGVEADTIKADLAFEDNLAKKEKELRAVIEQAAPAAPAPAPAAPETPEQKKLEIRHLLPHHTQLRAFSDGPEAVESAYRCGRWLKAHIYKNADDIRWCKDHGVEARALGDPNVVILLHPSGFEQGVLGHTGADAERFEYAHAVWAYLQTGAHFIKLRRLLEHCNPVSQFLERQPSRKAADPAARNQDMHRAPGLFSLMTGYRARDWS